MKKIVFMTGTRADFGKLKPLIEIAVKSKKFEIHIFATGMHMNPKYGKTVLEIVKCGYKNIFMYYNHTNNDPMDIILSKTIEGFSQYVQYINPDMVIVHGDRVEALAGAIVGSLNNILVAHVEGGEVSGTVDELIRHAVSKLSHIHLVSGDKAKKRLVQMGENENSVFVIGSPDIDIMFKPDLPDIKFVKKYYDVKFGNYAFLIFHPVTTEMETIGIQVKNVIDAVLKSDMNYIVVFPNNDMGSDLILHEYERLKNNKRFRIYPSLRFEYFLVLLKNAKFIIGNSSSGIREAPYYSVPAINTGTRQNNRSFSQNIINISCEKDKILSAIKNIENLKIEPSNEFGFGNSSKLFLDAIQSASLWKISKQKIFKDI